MRPKRSHTLKKLLKKTNPRGWNMNGMAEGLKKEGKVDEAIARFGKRGGKRIREKRRHDQLGDDLLREERLCKAMPYSSNW